MEVTVMSFLYALLIAMGLSGASYNDIANAFPDNTTQQNSVLYSIANDPTMNTGGFEFVPGETLPTNAVEIWEIPFRDAVNTYLQSNFDALMADLGFAIVQNNVDVAVDNGFTVNGAQWVGTMSNGVDTAIVSFVGTSQSAFRTYDSIPDTVGFNAGFGGVSYGKAVWRWSYGDTVIYSTSLGTNLNASIGLSSSYVNPHFEVSANGTLQFVYDYLSHSDGWQKTYTNFSIYDWVNQGITIDDVATFEPTESVSLGEEYLSFGDADNPVVGVTYDPATGVTTYKYKDGTISTSPPAVLGDSVSLSPSITQPLTNYIINEGDITNIYNPDAAIPSDSSIPFDFTSLGDLLYKEFTPVATFDFKPPYNRLVNKYDWETPFKKICQKFNINGRRPSYIISFVWLNKSFSFDVWGWCEYLLDSRGYALYMKFMRFFLYFGMVSGCLLLFLRSINVKLGTVIVSKG